MAADAGGGSLSDIAMSNHDPAAFEAAAREVGFLGFGFYPRSGFMHVDLGPARQWGERFPVRATAFAAETPPARERLADSRTMKGGGTAGVATLGAAGVEVAQQVLTETQTAILPLVPYVSRYAPLGVHRRRARQHRGHDLYSARRLEAGAAVIRGFVASLAGSAWARTALRSAVTAFAILLFLLALRRSGERVGRLDSHQDDATNGCRDDVDVLIDSSSHLVDLARGDADVAIRFGSEPDTSLVCHRLFDEELCAFSSPTVAEGLRDPADLARRSLIHWDTSTLGWAVATRKWVDWSTWLERTGAPQVVARRDLQLSDYNLAVQTAIAGQGVLLRSAPILEDLVSAGLLVRAVPQRLRTDVGYDVVATPTELERQEVKAFISWIVSKAELGAAHHCGRDFA